MSFTRLTLTNFQAHRRLKLKLSPSVTTIVGPTDRGKSAILRALRWLALGIPNGGNFLRYGQKKATAEIRTSDSLRIKRIRTAGGKSAYILSQKAVKGRERHVLKALKGKVPDVVSEALKLHPINFQSQHDTPFWFSQTPGEVSRQLNAIVNLDLMDQVLGQLNHAVRDSKARVETVKELLRESKQERKRLAYAPEMEAAFQDVMAKLAQWQGLYKRVGEMRHAVQDLAVARRDLKRVVPDFSPIEQALAKCQRIRERREAISNAIQDLREAQRDGIRTRLAMLKAEKKFHHNIKGKECPLCHHKM